MLAATADATPWAASAEAGGSPGNRSSVVRLRAAEAGALAAHDTQAVADSLLEHALTPLGAVAVAIWTVGSDGSLTRIERVYATGEPFRAHRVRLTALVDDVPLAAVADINITRHAGNVLLIWRIEDETARLASRLQHAQRLGRIGGFEENLLTGEIAGNGQLYSLYGRPTSSAPVSLEDLPAHAHPDDAVAIGRFLRTLLHHRRPASTAFRLQRPDGVTRHLRVVAEPVLDSDGRLFVVRGAYQDISAHHWTEVALAATRDQLAHTEQQASERNRLTLQLQHAIMPSAQAPLEAPACRSPYATGPPRRNSWSAATGTTRWCCRPSWYCCAWATWPGTA